MFLTQAVASVDGIVLTPGILSSAYMVAAFRPIQPIWQIFRRMYLCLITPPFCGGFRNHQPIKKCIFKKRLVAKRASVKLPFMD
jgi:hypothetical protein